MIQAIFRYLSTLADSFGAGWNRFWYQPGDPFVLGVLRVLTGLIGTYWVATYGFDLVRLFGPDGMLPPDLIDALRRLPRQPDERYYAFSYLFHLRGPAELWTAHAAGILVMLLFTCGVFTRYTSVLGLVVVLSYIHRAPVLTGQFEPILSFAMFYLCLGPAGACLSVDRLWRKRRKGGDSFAGDARNTPPRSFGATISIRLIQVHISVVYFMMALGKLAGPEEGENTWWLGDAVWWLMARPESRLVDLTGLFAEHPYLINAWSHAVVGFELAFAVLIWNRLARPLLLALAVPMWISLAMITGLVSFCTMMLVANLAFVPPAVLRSWIGSIRGGRLASSAGSSADGGDA